MTHIAVRDTVNVILERGSFTQPGNRTMLTHDEPRVASHLGFVHRDDRLCAGEFFLVVVREMALG